MTSKTKLIKIETNAVEKEETNLPKQRLDVHCYRGTWWRQGLNDSSGTNLNKLDPPS